MKTFFLTVLLLLGEWSYSFSIPPFTQPVVDEARMIHSRTAESLNQELSSLYNSGGPQIAILTLPSLEDQTVEERAIQVFDQWKIGKKGKDNGVLVLIAKKERKVRIEVGYGLEGDIPDAYAKRIVEDVILPQFRNGQFTNGVVFGVREIARLSHVALNTVPAQSRRARRSQWAPFILFLFLWVFMRSLISSRNRSGIHYGGRGPYSGGWGGGGWSGGGGSWGGGGGSSGGGGASGGW